MPTRSVVTTKVITVAQAKSLTETLDKLLVPQSEPGDPPIPTTAVTLSYELPLQVGPE